MHRSGFWIRTAATAIDAIVILVFAATIGVTADVLATRGTLTPSKERLLLALPLVLWLAYSSMEAMIGATPGKLVTNLVITLPDGAPAPPWTRLLRWSTKQSGWMFLLVFQLTGILFYGWLGGFLNLLLGIGCLRALGEDKLTWHDLWSHTAVVPRAVAAQMRNVHEDPEGVPPPT
jgi:uncharacterized RDD family membrane protein YckC